LRPIVAALTAKRRPKRDARQAGDTLGSSEIGEFVNS